METEKIDKLLELITEVVHEEGKTWMEKRNTILTIANPDQETDLQEFAGWFEAE